MSLPSSTSRKRQHGYFALPNSSETHIDTVSRNESSTLQTWGLKAAIMFFVAVLVSQIWSTSSQAVPAVEPSSQGLCDSPDLGFQCNTSISQNWGAYSPFFSVPSEIDDAVPEGCEVTFAQVLSRHGARDPTASRTKALAAMVDQIHSSVTKYGPGFEFIKDYQYKLGADQLSDFGRQQLVNSGLHFYSRYRNLAKDILPFIRSDGQERVVESGEKWAEGFHQALLDDGGAGSPGAEFPYSMVVIPTGDGHNNTLNHNLCTAFEEDKLGSKAMEEFANSTMSGILVRLNANLEGANLTPAQGVQMMDLCPFETVADTQGKLSQFCDLFTKDEWVSYGYLQTLGKWYGFGNGNKLGSTQGVGFVNELIARLTQQPVVDHTNTNSTLDSSPDTFPLDRKLYADFSHDNDMAGIYAALGLFNSTAADGLPKNETRTPAEIGGYSASRVVPFAARMYVEKMKCGADVTEELVRILVNNRVMKLYNCDADELGRCTLSNFVESMSFAREGGYWDQCWV